MSAVVTPVLNCPTGLTFLRIIILQIETFWGLNSENSTLPLMSTDRSTTSTDLRFNQIQTQALLIQPAAPH